MPRVLTRAERLELVSALPEDERDRRYVQKLVGIAIGRMRMPKWRAEAWAEKQLAKRKAAA